MVEWRSMVSLVDGEMMMRGGRMRIPTSIAVEVTMCRRDHEAEGVEDVGEEEVEAVSTVKPREMTTPRLTRL